MAAQALLNVDIFAGGYALESDTNKIAWSDEFAELPATTFGSEGKTEYLAGLHTTTIELGGWLNTATGRSEPVLRSMHGTVDGLFTWTPNGTANDAAMFCRGLTSKLSKGGPVGEISPFSANMVSNAAEGALDGHLILPRSTITATGSATGFQNGAVASGRTLYAGLHVFSVSGSSTPTITVKVQSDDNSGFSSATDRITFTAATALGSELKSLAGAIADDWWRVTYTVSGSSPSFSAAVVMAIA